MGFIYKHLLTINMNVDTWIELDSLLCKIALKRLHLVHDKNYKLLILKI